MALNVYSEILKKKKTNKPKPLVVQILIIGMASKTKQRNIRLIFMPTIIFILKLILIRKESIYEDDLQ